MRKAIKKAKTHAEELEKIATRSNKKYKMTPAKREKLVKRVTRKLREIFYGEKTYLPKKLPKSKQGVGVKRTVAGLKQAGLSKKEIQRLK